MARSNREVSYPNFLTYVEHVTGKKIRSYEYDYMRACTNILFDDETMIRVREGEALDENHIVYERPTGYFCVSCGERSHGACEFDWRGWCTTTVSKFSEKVRKLYWHRYLKNK